MRYTLPSLSCTDADARSRSPVPPLFRHLGTWPSLLLAPGPLAGGEPAGPLLNPNIFHSNGFKSDSTYSVFPCKLLGSLYHHTLQAPISPAVPVFTRLFAGHWGRRVTSSPSAFKTFQGFMNCTAG